MGKSELYDDIYFVWKGNSGGISENDGIFTEIVDFQIPRGYAVRIRKVITEFQVNEEQLDQDYFRILNALVLDPDDDYVIFHMSSGELKKILHPTGLVGCYLQDK